MFRIAGRCAKITIVPFPNISTCEKYKKHPVDGEI